MSSLLGTMKGSLVHSLSFLKLKLFVDVGWHVHVPSPARPPTARVDSTEVRRNGENVCKCPAEDRGAEGLPRAVHSC